ncbi:GGDEF domain-containing protein [Duganella radicis]|uniref:diguanylate cyclase n=1 Tax=Duganella radicis TaxID=551988 RepID=A0A6L6PBB1_9BURK|nr:GGDEF domain-containing protein [Duganella radicis]MTV36254.1 diguanylate cyclase [Duganella radicis]
MKLRAPSPADAAAILRRAVRRYRPPGAAAMPPQAEREMLARHDGDVARWLPPLGALFGALVVLFGIWDALLDRSHYLLSLTLRLTLVLAGAPALWNTHWHPGLRCLLLYWSHCGAVVLACFVLDGGVLYGMAGMTACVAMAAVMTLRPRILLSLFSLPFALYLALGAWRLPPFTYLSGLMQYLLAMALATAVMLIIRSFHRRAFLLERELLHSARHDGLTGACNRAYLDQMGERELTLALRHGRPLAVAMLDIDHFKRVNDNYGHDVGDQVLRALARTCQDTLRGVDHFGRYGGEEFVCILPETARAEALACAERLRLALAALAIETPAGPLRFTVSVGVALASADQPGWPALLKRADTALYRAKNSGRDQVALAGA